MNASQPLCPAQQRALDQLVAGLDVGTLFCLSGGIGLGKTPLLKTLHQRIGGAFLGMKDFVEASTRNHPLAVEETAYTLVLDALQAHPLVIVADVKENKARYAEAQAQAAMQSKTGAAGITDRLTAAALMDLQGENS